MTYPGFTADLALDSAGDPSYIASPSVPIGPIGEVSPANAICRVVCNFACVYAGGDPDACTSGCIEKCKGIVPKLA